MPSRPVQRQLARLLDAIFQLDTPADVQLEFERRIVPVWNVEPLIAGRADYTWTVGTAAPGAGVIGTISFVVPANDEWHVAIIGAGHPAGTFAAQPWWVIRPNGSGLAAGLGYGLLESLTPPSSGAAVAGPDSAGRVFAQPLVVSAGESLICRWFNTTGGALTFHAGVLRRVITLGA